VPLLLVLEAMLLLPVLLLLVLLLRWLYGLLRCLPRLCNCTPSMFCSPTQANAAGFRACFFVVNRSWGWTKERASLACGGRS
jgi:hypothetical protein